MVKQSLCDHEMQKSQGTNFWFYKEVCKKCNYTKWIDRKQKAKEDGIDPETCPHGDLKAFKIKGQDAYRYYCSICYDVVEVRSGEEEIGRAHV